MALRLTVAAALLAGHGAFAGCMAQWPAGTQFGAQYSAPSNATAANMTAALYAQVRAAGGVLAQIGLTWAGLEQTPGQPNFAILAGVLQEAKAAGAVPLVNLGVIDTTRMAVPSDLVDPANPTRLRPGLNFMSPEVLNRYLSILQVAMPIIAYYGGGYIGTGNEVTSNLGMNPDYVESFIQLTDVVKQLSAQVTNPPLEVGATLILADIAAPKPPTWLPWLAQVADVMPVTYYPLVGGFDVETNWTAVEATMAAGLGALPAGACIVFQELGYPSGYNNASSTDGSSDKLQAAFFSNILGWLARFNGTDGRVLRGVSVYELVDMPEAECAALGPYYNVSNPAFFEYLCTLGTVRGDGTAKPAFQTMLDGFAQLTGV